MGTVKSLITRSLRALIVLSEGEEATAEMINDGLTTLKDLLNSWSIEGMMVPYSITETFTLNPLKQAYTWKTGGDFNSASPFNVKAVSFQIGNYQNPIDRMDRRAFMGLPNLGITAEPKFYLFEEGPTYPTFTLNVLPYGGQLVIESEKAIDTSFILTDETTLPDAYDRVIRTNLAIELAPDYSKSPSVALIATAKESKTILERHNSAPPPTMRTYVPGQRSSHLLPLKTS